MLRRITASAVAVIVTFVLTGGLAQADTVVIDGGTSSGRAMVSRQPVPPVPPKPAPKPKLNAKGAWPTDTVYIQLHGVAKRWPVKKAAARLDDGSPLSLKVVKTCPLGKPCIDVYDKATIKGTAVGETYLYHRSDGRLSAALVYYENAYGKNATSKHRFNVTIHELGHAVGLDHRKCGSTIMCAHVTNVQKLNKGDKSRLNKLY